MPDLGIGELIASFLSTDLGVGAATAGVLGTGLADAGIGAATSAITGGNPLTGAITGGLTGGLTSAFGGDVASGLGIGQQGADALIGAASGTVGGAATGGKNLLLDALSGAALGYGSAPTGGVNVGSGISGTSNAPPAVSPTSVPPATGLGGGGSSAVAGVLPYNLSPTIDLTNISLPSLDPTGGASGSGGGIGGGSGTTTTGGAGSSGGSLGSKLLNGIENNPLAAINSVGGILQGQQNTKNLDATVKQLQTEAGGINTQAAALEAPLSTGVLPPGAQAAINQATAAAKASIRGKYAQLGLSGSSMETQELNGVDTSAAGQVVSLANQLYQTGISQQSLSTSLYDAIIQAQGNTLNQGNAAVTNYAAALAGGNYAPKATAP